MFSSVVAFVTFGVLSVTAIWTVWTEPTKPPAVLVVDPWTENCRVRSIRS